MALSTNTLLTAIIGLSTLAAVSPEAQACPPRGGGYGGYASHYSGGYSSGYSSGGYRSSGYGSYSGPNGYTTQNYGYSQPEHGNGYGQPTQIAQPIQQVSQPQFAQQPQQQAPQQQFAQQPQQQAPQQQSNSAAMSALQALGGFAPPQTSQPTQQPQQTQTPAHVGNWTSTLGNGSTVRLSLQADGSFVWTATNKAGTSSSFSGSYTVGNGSLNLNRGNDGQTLSGGMTTNGNNSFSFKVAGNNAASIEFSRS